MGIYTPHWRRYQRESQRGTFIMLAMLCLGIPSMAFIGYLLEPLGTLETVVLLSLFSLWLVAFTVVAIRYSKVVCPRCGQRYSRGKYLVDCPQCGLRMLQEDP